MAFYKIQHKFKINYKTKSNIWGHIHLNNKLTKKKWRGIYLYSLLQKIRFISKIKKQPKKPPLRYSYKINLQEKQKLRFFYGKILNFQLKKIYFKTKQQNIYNLSENFIQNIESRLDVTLYRTGFFQDIFETKTAIKYNLIKVNNKIIKHYHHILSPGDVITLNISKKNKHKLISKMLKKFYIFLKFNIKLFKKLNFPEHLEINYKTLSVVFLYKPDLNNLYYPTDINFFRMSRNYK